MKNFQSSWRPCGVVFSRFSPSFYTGNPGCTDLQALEARGIFHEEGNVKMEDGTSPGGVDGSGSGTPKNGTFTHTSKKGR